MPRGRLAGDVSNRCPQVVDGRLEGSETDLDLNESTADGVCTVPDVWRQRPYASIVLSSLNSSSNCSWKLGTSQVGPTPKQKQKPKHQKVIDLPQIR